MAEMIGFPYTTEYSLDRGNPEIIDNDYGQILINQFKLINLVNYREINCVGESKLIKTARDFFHHRIIIFFF